MSDYRTDIASIWQMFDESGALAHRAAIASAQQAASSGALNTSTLNAAILNGTGVVLPSLDLMLQAVVTVGEKTDEGQIIETVSHAWRQIVTALSRNPQLMHELDWRTWEEMIAGGYKAAGYDIVTLTSRSGDFGRDIIATRDDLGSIRSLTR